MLLPESHYDRVFIRMTSKTSEISEKEARDDKRSEDGLSGDYFWNFKSKNVLVNGMVKTISPASRGLGRGQRKKMGVHLAALDRDPGGLR